jgi:hypothetical protein
MGPVCATVSDSVDTVDAIDTVDLDGRDTTNWAMASSTAVQEAAVARRQANSSALEWRYNYAFICYHAGVTPDGLLTDFCQRNRGWGCEICGKASILVTYTVTRILTPALVFLDNVR